MMTTRKQLCVSASPELYRRAKEQKIQWSEALRVGIATIEIRNQINLPENTSEFSKRVLLERYKEAMIKFIEFSKKMEEYVEKEEAKVRNIGL